MLKDRHSSDSVFMMLSLILPDNRGELEKMELYRQFPPRRVKDAQLKELGKYECVSSVMTISSVLNTERYKMGTKVILLKIGNGVYVCICTVYTSILKNPHNMNSSITVI